MNSPRIGPKYTVGSTTIEKINMPVEKKKQSTPKKIKKVSYHRFNENSKQRRLDFTKIETIEDIAPQITTEESVEKLQQIHNFAARHIQSKLRLFINKTQNKKSFPKIYGHPQTEIAQEEEEQKENNISQQEVTEEQIEEKTNSQIINRSPGRSPRQKMIVETTESPMKYKSTQNIKPMHLNNSLNLSVRDRAAYSRDFPVVTVPENGEILNETVTDIKDASVQATPSSKKSNNVINTPI
ncbi:hypothetical protein TVAG_199480 [Trichomonas vaginalis G3]|uniref:Uncharacterized protein n=1 Tax=Trichomonas vaginalis (strain ATCC PRA-98 / G3) TaxID=412133 RepID=A2DDY3_TRIV3|nr:hypothetical protein TVAGG3_1000090 [Trichomonas vaginalis G3]EAY21509.1 hypothetical protein TVAG_199480 [Trichomonas vaginalis G3]KAI5490725.1 hypothetical protein TVAGG3_1000090 [Trichomonas vaginalis G3]|eukprot:XP_001582495.1 hypothetical protein [Trichomonas vaginalis G3]